MEIYRPSDAQKWNDKRFRQLTFAEKCVYVYLWDNFNTAGFYKISDPEMDVLKLGPDMKDEKHYKLTIESLCQPKEGPNGIIDRGWIRVGTVVWCSYFIKHTQKNFGSSFDNRHKQVLQILVSHWDEFNEAAEYRKIMESVDDRVWRHFKGIDNPLMLEKLSSNKLPTQKESPKPKAVPPSSNLFMDVINAWNQVTGFNDLLNPFREQKIKDRIREGHSVEDMKIVFKAKYLDWKDKPEMKDSLTLDTILKPDKFPKFLEIAKRNQSTSGKASFSIK